ncbi:MAG: glycosyltransferase family 2 protein [Chloroflexi bacterium]|nr:glycosyltransferase family 2 protein [Chloroflexota bacterium]
MHILHIMTQHSALSTQHSVEPSVAAAVLVKDEEAVLAECLETLRWADELVVVVDEATRDRSAEIARRFTAHIHVRPFTSFPDQRNAALALACSEWVLFVDADERVSPELAAEVRAVVAAPGECDGFWIPRRNVICGRVVRHAGWWPDEQLRLLRRARARFDPERLVHELATLEGPAGHLRQPFLHYNYDNLAEFCRKQERYSALEAQRLFRLGARPRARSFVGQPAREFWRRYVAWQGYREGWLGLALSALLACYTLRSQRRLAALWRARGSDPAGHPTS